MIVFIDSATGTNPRTQVLSFSLPSSIIDHNATETNSSSTSSLFQRLSASKRNRYGPSLSGYSSTLYVTSGTVSGPGVDPSLETLSLTSLQPSNDIEEHDNDDNNNDTALSISTTCSEEKTKKQGQKEGTKSRRAGKKSKPSWTHHIGDQSCPQNHQSGMNIRCGSHWYFCGCAWSHRIRGWYLLSVKIVNNLKSIP
jgi:hypothetical protein